MVFVALRLTLTYPYSCCWLPLLTPLLHGSHCFLLPAPAVAQVSPKAPKVATAPTTPRLISAGTAAATRGLRA